MIVLHWMDIRKIHECEKSEGKIVAIEIDAIGNTYCHQRAEYKLLLKK